MTKTNYPTPEDLEKQKAIHKRRKFLRALFEGKLSRRNRPTVSGYTTGGSGGQ